MKSHRTPGRPDGPEPVLQPELTRLAWRRTTLGAAVIVLVAGTSVLVHQAPLATLALLAPAALAWAGVLIVAYRRGTALSRQPVAADGTAPLQLTMLAVVLALCAGGAALVIAAVGAP